MYVFFCNFVNGKDLIQNFCAKDSFMYMYLKYGNSILYVNKKQSPSQIPNKYLTVSLKSIIKKVYK